MEDDTYRQHHLPPFLCAPAATDAAGALVAVWLAVLAPMNAQTFNQRTQPAPSEQTALAACVAMGPRQVRERDSKGFTLIEMSIVLVNIGLLVGGILVGRDLIKAAELRAQVGQIEKYNAAVNTFRNKFGYLPGDIPAAQAAQVGLATRSGAIGHGDGNGLLEGGGARFSSLCAENILFWHDLSTSNLIDGAFTGPDGCVAANSVAAVQALVPPAKLGGQNSITVYADSGFNYYQMLQIYAITGGGALPGAGYGQTALEAFTIDTKIDDGLPLSGTVRARAVTFGGGPPAMSPVDGYCISIITSGNPYEYKLYPNRQSCSLSIRFQ